eukprot:2012729-Prymnesium_polylepis.1
MRAPSTHACVSARRVVPASAAHLARRRRSSAATPDAHTVISAAAGARLSADASPAASAARSRTCCSWTSCAARPVPRTRGRLECGLPVRVRGPSVRTGEGPLGSGAAPSLGSGAPFSLEGCRRSGRSVGRRRSGVHRPRATAGRALSSRSRRSAQPFRAG